VRLNDEITLTFAQTSAWLSRYFRKSVRKVVRIIHWTWELHNLQKWYGSGQYAHKDL